MMKCHVCGASLRAVLTDLPFKLSEHTIVIIKGVPVLQCDGCREFLIEDNIMEHVEALLAKVERTAELEVVRFAA